MTESEAQEKDCRNIVFTEYENGQPLHNYCPSCIASDCALWQWNGYSDSNGSAKTGYCGLRGK